MVAVDNLFENGDIGSVSRSGEDLFFIIPVILQLHHRDQVGRLQLMEHLGLRAKSCLMFRSIMGRAKTSSMSIPSLLCN